MPLTPDTVYGAVYTSYSPFLKYGQPSPAIPISVTLIPFPPDVACDVSQ